jgi:hypothetical protein
MSLIQYILKKRKEIDQFRKRDKIYLKFSKEHQDLKDQIQCTFAQIQRLSDDFPDEQERNAQLTILDDSMTQLSELIKMNEQETEEHCAKKFPEFHRRYPGIFKMFISGNVDTTALNHVLDTLTMVERGQITIEQGKEMGYQRFMN